MSKTINYVKHFVGIDISKKSLEIARLDKTDKIKRFKCKTNNLKPLFSWLKGDELVALEAGSQAFRIAKLIKRRTTCDVIVLNPGDIANIYNSLKKTDKEDALKLARLIQRNPKEELPEVPVPTDEQEYARRLSTERAFWIKQKSQLKNRLHALFTQAGLTHISRKHLSREFSRDESLKDLPKDFIKEAVRLHKQLIQVERTVEEMDIEIRDLLKEHVDQVAILFSMPGIGPVLALAIWGYLANPDRFSKAKQVSYYVGLVPKVDSSGDSIKYGHIIKRSCHPIKRCIVQGTWSLVRSKLFGGVIKEFYERKKDQIGKKKAIIAAARKQIETIFVMLKKGELYQGTDIAFLEGKLKTHGLIN